MKRFMFLWGPVILFAMFIFIMSSISSSEGKDPFPHFDKVAHFLVYGAFALLVFRSFARTIGRKSFLFIALITVIVTVAYGLGDEFHQSFVPTRNPDVMDIAADGTGALTAMTAMYIWRRARRSYRVEPP